MAALKRSDECVSDLVFDEWLSESIAPAARRALEAHLEHCVSCAVRGDALATQREAFLKRLPDWQALTTSVRGHSRARWPWAASVTLTAAAAALALVFMRPHEVGVRSKGRAHIGAFIKRGEHVEQAEPGAIVHAGDLVRFTYSSDVPVYFGLLNHDQQRAVTYYPLAAQTVRVPAGRDIGLDFSIELDATPGRELVYGLFCSEAEALEPLRAQLQATGALPALPHCRVDLLTLEKGEPGE